MLWENPVMFLVLPWRFGVVSPGRHQWAVESVRWSKWGSVSHLDWTSSPSNHNPCPASAWRWWTDPKRHQHNTYTVLMQFRVLESIHTGTSGIEEEHYPCQLYLYSFKGMCYIVCFLLSRLLIPKWIHYQHLNLFRIQVDWSHYPTGNFLPLQEYMYTSFFLTF